MYFTILVRTSLRLLFFSFFFNQVNDIFSLLLLCFIIYFVLLKYDLITHPLPLNIILSIRVIILAFFTSEVQLTSRCSTLYRISVRTLTPHNCNKTIHIYGHTFLFLRFIPVIKSIFYNHETNKCFNINTCLRGKPRK